MRPAGQEAADLGSDQSGFMGFGPSSNDGGDDKDKSLPQALKDAGKITKNIVTYNITFNADGDAENSYI